MKKLYLQSMFVLSILVMSLSAQAQPLWRETASGMSPSQIIDIVKGARFIRNGEMLVGEAKELIRLDDLHKVNNSFKVEFYFIDEKLTQVTLNLNKERSFSSTLLVFDSLADELRSKYGKEISRNINSRPGFKKAEANWVSGSTNINLLVLAIGDSPALLNVNYQTRLPPEADKL